jgi:tripartite-type tricarboxylate transporter receptor subunit TctC
MDPRGSTPQEFAQLVRKDAERWAKVVKEQGIRAE